MTDQTHLYADHVPPEWVDYNRHMNDAEYARAFTIAVDALMDDLGIDAEFRERHQYSVYTLETHLCYLAELNEGEYFHITAQLLDHDAKRLHVFFTLEDQHGTRAATSEQMLMGMDMKLGKPAPFPSPVDQAIERFAQANEDHAVPDEAGRVIGIRRHK